MIRVFLLLPKLLACAQVNIMLHNQTQMAEAEYAFNWTWVWRNSNTKKLFFQEGIQRYDVNRIETPWWQFQSFSNLCSLSKKILVNGIVSIYLNLIKVIKY
jgi:hypothetical protein